MGTTIGAFMSLYWFFEHWCALFRKRFVIFSLSLLVMEELERQPLSNDI